MIKLGSCDEEIALDYLQRVQCNHKGPYRGKGGGKRVRVRDITGGRSEQCSQEPGTQVASRSRKRKGTDLPLQNLQKECSLLF